MGFNSGFKGLIKKFVHNNQFCNMNLHYQTEHKNHLLLQCALLYMDLNLDATIVQQETDEFAAEFRKW